MEYPKVAKADEYRFSDEVLTPEAKRKRHLSLQLKGQFHARLRARRKDHGRDHL